MTVKKLTWIPAAFVLALAGPALAEEESSSEEGGEEETEEGSAEEQDAKKAAKAAQSAGEEAVEEGADAVEQSAKEAAKAAQQTATEEELEAAAAEAAAAAAGEGSGPEEAPAEEAEKKPEVSLVAEAGLVWLHGNTKSITANGAVHFGLKHDRNKFTLHFGANYGRSVVADEWAETAKKIGGDLRYDRFFTDFNSIYLSGGAFHDPFAGFLVRARGDVGYSHLLVQTEVHKLAVEGGFNYTRDQYWDASPDDGVDPDPAGQNFFGGRIFAGYGLTPNANFGFSQAIEVLIGGTDNADAPFDGRLLSDTSVTLNATSILAFKFGFLVNWDFEPPVKEDGTQFDPVDLTTTAALVATFM